MATDPPRSGLITVPLNLGITAMRNCGLFILLTFLFCTSACTNSTPSETAQTQMDASKQPSNKPDTTDSPTQQTTDHHDDAIKVDSDTATVQIVYSKKYLINLGGLEKTHPFDIRKYEKIHRALVAAERITKETAVSPEPLSREQMLLIHSAEYIDRLKKRRNIARYLESPLVLGYPFSLDKAILRPFRYAAGGTILASRKALDSGIGINIGGGYHHAKPDTGEGFCIYADVPIAIRQLQKEQLIERALIIDVDAHQGNGTAVCLADDDSTFTYSIHQENIYPIPKEKSDLDDGIAAGTGDDDYLQLLESRLDFLFEKSSPDICFIVGGCDTLADDPLTGLKMTHEGIVKRDSMIVDACVKRKIPVVLTLSGGYSDNAWEAQYKSIAAIIKTHGLSRNESGNE